MLQSDSARAQVRQQLDQLLRTDADLDAFCLDYFPEVHRRFARGMERTDKVNLLLSVAELADIETNLRRCTSPPAMFMSQPRWWWAALSLVLLALSGGGLYAAFRRGAESRPAARPAVPFPATAQPVVSTTIPPRPTGINSGNVIRDSAGAELRNRAPSAALRDLGASINSGNRIEGSPGAVISNEVGGP